MTKDSSKTKAQLLNEIAMLRKQIESDQSRELFENAPLPYQSLDDKGTILDVNDAWLKLMGYKKAEVLGRFIGAFLTSDSAASLRENFHIIMDNGEVHQAEFTMVKRDGSHILVSVDGRIAYDEFGTFSRTHCILHDITDQRRAEKDLSTSEQRFRGLFESSLDGILFVDTSGSILNVNQAFCTMLGSTSDNLLGKNILDITPQKAHALEKDIFNNKDIPDGYSDEFEKKYIHSDGHLVPVAVRVWLNVDDQGTPTGSWSVVRDLTDQKAAEKVAAKSERMYQLLAENAEDVIWTSDIDFNYTYMSPSIFKLRGFTSEEVMKGTFKESITQESYLHVADVIRQTLESEAKGIKDDIRSIEVELICKDGSTIWAEVIARVTRDENGKRTGYYGTTRNISERKRAELLLRERESFLRALLNATSDSAGLFFPDGTILTINQNMADSMGSPLEDMIGQNIFTYIPSPIVEDRKKYFKKVVKNKVPLCIKDVHSGRIIETVIYPILGGNGEVSSVAVYAKDITDSVLSEQAYKKSQEQYRLFVETANEGILGFDANQCITYANRVAEESLGYKSGELIGVPVSTLLRLADIDEHKERLKRRSRGERERYEQRFVCKDGSIIWGLVSVTPLLDENNLHIGSFAMIANITKAKATEKIIRESEERYRRIVETANEGILQINIDGSIEFANKRLGDILGYTMDEMLSMTGVDLLFPEGPERLMDIDARRARGLSDSYEQCARHKDGHDVWVQVSGSPIFNDDGIYQGSLGMVMDISERKRAEQALKLTQFSVDNAAIDSYWLNAEGRVVYANAHVCESLGYTLEEMLTLSISDINPNSLPEEWSDHWLERKQYRVRQFESIHQHKDGHEFPVGITSYYWEDDEQEYLFTYSYDLSDHKRVEEKLRRSQALLNEVQQTSRTGGWEVDVTSGEVLWTDGQFRLHGMEPDVVPVDLKRFFDFYVHPSDRSKLVQGWKKITTEHVPVEIEYRAIKADGTEAIFMVIATPEVDEAGTLRRIFGSTRDITLEKQAAQDIKQAHERLLSLLDGMDAIIYVSDMDTHEVLFMNAHAKDLFGSLSEIAACHEIFRGEKEECSFCPKKRLLNERGLPMGTVVEELYNPLTNSWYLNHDRAIEWLEGKQVHMHMATDITELKTMAENLKTAMGDAQAASIAKNEFLANMSHEIRTPLNGLLGMLQLLQLSNLDGEQLDYLSTAVDSGRSLLQILNDILDLSKVESGKLELDEYSFDLSDVLNSVVAVFRYQAKSRGITMSWKIDESLHRHFKGDKGRLRQILFNLVGNSAKFTESGTVVIEAYPLNTSLKSGKTLISFTVTDTGIGIPEDKLDHVFAPFTQVDGSLTRKHKGTGLGLGIVRRLVKLMGGTVSIISQEGKGTSITFTIAVTPDHEEKKETAIVQVNADYKKFSILVAEDERVNRTVVQHLLDKLGHSPLCVENGERALETLESQTFDCILMDIQMPGIDGLETTRLIREKMKIDIPVIALTAHAMKGDRKRFLEAGMTGYVSKPFDITELQEEIERVMAESAN